MKIKNWSFPLITATILVTVVRYSAAFMASDLGQITGVLSEVVTFFLTLTGLGMGILDTLGGGLLFNGWRKVMPRAGDKWNFKFKVLTFCVFGLVLSGLVILVPFTVSRMSQESVTEALGGRGSLGVWFWAGMVNIIPYFLIAGIFVGNKMVEDLESSEPYKKLTKEQEKNNEFSENLPKDWRKLRPTLQYEDVVSLAHLSSSQIKEFSDKYKVDERTVINWRIYARREITNEHK